MQCDKRIFFQKKIHSFVRRNGRITKGQWRALRTLWPKMGINYQSSFLDFQELFGRSVPVTLEIGFGTGISLVNTAITHPDKCFIGIEVYLSGIGACLINAHRANVSNLRIIYHDAVEVLERMVPDDSLTSVQLFFPDPWQKKRHNKRRIIQTPFVELVSRKLLLNGRFHIVTDWRPYAEHVMTILSANKSFLNLSPTGDYMPRPIDRPLTKFECRGQKLGHCILDLIFKKIVNTKHLQ